MSLPTTPAERKACPVYSGFVRYFPDAMVAVAELSRIGNEQHNPGTPLHWDRSKSGDEADALQRHLIEAGTVDTDGVRHSTKVAWRAMALLQKEIEKERQSLPDGLSMSPGAAALVIKLPETEFGFTIGETVNATWSPAGEHPGKVVGFDGGYVDVKWQSDLRSIRYLPNQLRHGE